MGHESARHVGYQPETPLSLAVYHRLLLRCGGRLSWVIFQWIKKGLGDVKAEELLMKVRPREGSQWQGSESRQGRRTVVHNAIQQGQLLMLCSIERT